MPASVHGTKAFTTKRMFPIGPVTRSRSFPFPVFRIFDCCFSLKACFHYFPMLFHTHKATQSTDVYKNGKGRPYSITELIPVLGSQPAGDVSHKSGGRLSLLSARPAVPSQPLRGLLPISLLGEQRHDGCEQFAKDCYLTASRLRFEPGPFCA